MVCINYYARLLYYFVNKSDTKRSLKRANGDELSNLLSNKSGWYIYFLFFFTLAM